jgi:hypothetical protein
MNIEPQLSLLLATELGTQIYFIPQTHLGLPLSPYKLPQSAFQPLIDRIDKILASWCADLLFKGGCLLLLSAALNSMLTYFMSSVLIPMVILEKN